MGYADQYEASPVNIIAGGRSLSAISTTYRSGVKYPSASAVTGYSVLEQALASFEERWKPYTNKTADSIEQLGQAAINSANDMNNTDAVNAVIHNQVVFGEADTNPVSELHASNMQGP